MGVRYVKGPQGQEFSPAMRSALTKKLMTCAEPNNTLGLINTFYNSAEHFGMPMFDTVPHAFLKDIQTAANSTHHTIEVMGTEHTDPFGHSTVLIGQYDMAYGTFYPAIVKDCWIRFRIVLDHQHYKIFHSLSESKIYHLLIDTPTIVHLQLGVRTPVVMMQIPDLRLAPHEIRKYTGKIRWATMRE